MSVSIRLPAVAGLFYPSDAKALRRQIQHCAVQAENKFPPTEITHYRALVAPHAGYQYSGRVAAAAYRYLPVNQAKKIAILGPSHRVPLLGIAAPASSVFETPLGGISIDQFTVGELIELALVHYNDVAHAPEHSIEVQLPFLQSIVDDFDLVPLLVGESDPALVAALIEELIQRKFFIIISTDLSHFLTYDAAQQADTRTTQKVLGLNWHLRGEDACGCRALNGLLKYADDRQLGVSLIAQENSGDLTGDRSRVVGYGAYGLVGGS